MLLDPKQPDGTCKINGNLVLVNYGHNLMFWTEADACGWMATGGAWAQITLPPVECAQCTVALRPAGVKSAPATAAACVSVAAPDQPQKGLPQVNAAQAHYAARLRCALSVTSCKPSTRPGPI